MKPEHIISHYLIMHSNVSLQEIGTFTYTGATVNIDDLSRDISFPENSIQFQYNPKAITDEAFLLFITKHTGKLRSLVASDFESYLLTGKQFLNIGKALIIKDIGFLIKQQDGNFEFTQGVHRNVSIDTNYPGDKNYDHEIGRAHV